MLQFIAVSLLIRHCLCDTLLIEQASVNSTEEQIQGHVKILNASVSVLLTLQTISSKSNASIHNDKLYL